VAGGPYAINKGTLAANSNYNLTFGTGVNFNITARPITVTADAQSKVYGADDPALTYKLTNGTLGFNDTLAGVLTGSLDRATGQTVAGSPYAINKGSLAANGNYSLTFNGANLDHHGAADHRDADSARARFTARTILRSPTSSLTGRMPAANPSAAYLRQPHAATLADGGG
jgi:hypothetical protein